MGAEAVTVTLGQDEALVLFEWLHRLGEREDAWVDQAEQRAVWDLTASLEKQIETVLADDCKDQLRAARDRVRDATD